MYKPSRSAWLCQVAFLLLVVGAASPAAQASEPVATPSASAERVAPISPATDWRTAVRNFAQTHLKNPAWGYSHSMRDYQLARSLAASDHVSLDDDVLFAAAYLHDVGAFPPYQRQDRDHSDIGADIVGQLLSGTGFPMSKLPQVQAAIRTHMYYRRPVGAVAIYLHDADALDWLGAIGVARIFGVLVDPHGGQPDEHAAVRRLQELLTKVPPGVVSRAGKAVLARRTPELQRFLSELAAETSDYKTL